MEKNYNFLLIKFIALSFIIKSVYNITYNINIVTYKEKQKELKESNNVLLKYKLSK